VVSTAYVALFSWRDPLFRVGAALFSVAALMGALKFSGLYADEQPHRLLAMIAGVAGFPAMVISIALPEWKLIDRWGTSLLLVSIIAIAGVWIVTTTGARLYLDAVALLSPLAVGYACWRQRAPLGVVSAVVILLGLICFALKIPSETTVQPADVLHLALAAGWLGLHQQQAANPRADSNDR
jgi:hypothetical protein